MKKTALRGALATAATVPLLLAGSGQAAAAEASAFVLGPIAIVTVTDIDPVLGVTPLCTVASLLPPLVGVPLFDATDLLNLPETQRFLVMLEAAAGEDEVTLEVICTPVLDQTEVVIDLTSSGSIS